MTCCTLYSRGVEGRRCFTFTSFTLMIKVCRVGTGTSTVAVPVYSNRQMLASFLHSGRPTHIHGRKYNVHVVYWLGIQDNIGATAPAGRGPAVASKCRQPQQISHPIGQDWVSLCCSHWHILQVKQGCRIHKQTWRLDFAKLGFAGFGTFL